MRICEKVAKIGKIILFLVIISLQWWRLKIKKLKPLVLALILFCTQMIVFAKIINR